MWRVSGRTFFSTLSDFEIRQFGQSFGFRKHSRRYYEFIFQVLILRRGLVFKSELQSFEKELEPMH